MAVGRAAAVSVAASVATGTAVVTPTVAAAVGSTGVGDAVDSTVGTATGVAVGIPRICPIEAGGWSRSTAAGGETSNQTAKTDATSRATSDPR